MHILTYSTNSMRKLADAADTVYLKNLTQMLTFEKWASTAMNILYKEPEKFSVNLIKPGTQLRMCPDSHVYLKILRESRGEIENIQRTVPVERQQSALRDLFKERLIPKYVITQPDNLYLDRVDKSGKATKIPIWFNNTLKGINIRLGFANMDSASPGVLPLNDDTVHMLLGGKTGAGKSVALHTLICNLLLEYAPWVLDVYLMDFKQVELSKYAKIAEAPHVRMIGATESSEFALSMFTRLTDELNARKELFLALNVNGIAEFTALYGLIMPRIVLVADEFVQLVENIAKAAARGSSNSDEQKAAIFAAISELARLGRSYGMHMLLSSQSMDGVLDDQTANQFSAGVSLAATPGVSKTLIGNEAASRLTGKGKCIVNPAKVLHDEKDNIYTRVPFIDNKPPDDEPDKITYLIELLIDLEKKAREVGYENHIYTYNESVPVPSYLIEEDITAANEYQNNPPLPAIEIPAFKEEVTEVFALGRSVCYSVDPVVKVPLLMRKNNSLLVAATDKADRRYMLKMLIDNLADDDWLKHIVVLGDPTLCESLRIMERLPNVKAYRARKMPEIYTAMQGRKTLMDIYTRLVDDFDGQWNTSVALGMELGTGQLYKYHKQAAVIYDQILAEGKSSADLSAALATIGMDNYFMEKMIEACARANGHRLAMTNLTKNWTVPLTPKSFQRTFVWFMGLDEMNDMMEAEEKKRYSELAKEGPAVGIHCVFTAEYWDKVGLVADSCNFIMEKCLKQFFMDCGIPANININANSFQLINQQLKTNTIIRQYTQV